MLRDSRQLIRRSVVSPSSNVDVTVILERPKIAPFIDAIRAELAAALRLRSIG